MRDAHKEIINAEEIRVKNHTKKEFFPKVKEILSSFQLDIDSIIRNKDKMKEKYMLAEREISVLINTMCIQDRLINRRELNDIKPILIDNMPKENPIKKEISVLQPKLGCLREVAAEFNRDSQNAEEKVAKIQSEINIMKNIHNSQVEKMKTFYENKEEEISKETYEIKQQFEQYKVISEHELQMREIICKRQKDFILKLYGELGNSKYIFNNPRLRQLLHMKTNAKAENQEKPQSPNPTKRPGISTGATKFSENESLGNTRPVTRDFRSTVSPKLKKFEDSINLNFTRPFTRDTRSLTPYK